MHPVRRQTSPHAAQLRRDRTEVENTIWQALRNRQLEGFKFRFQASIWPYVADFLCVEAKLIVEMDGGQHSAELDARRTVFLEAQGYQVLRFWNIDVVENRAGVLEAIRLALIARMAEKQKQKKTLTQPVWGEHHPVMFRPCWEHGRPQAPAKAGEGFQAGAG